MPLHSLNSVVPIRFSATDSSRVCGPNHSGETLQVSGHGVGNTGIIAVDAMVIRAAIHRDRGRAAESESLLGTLRIGERASPSAKISSVEKAVPAGVIAAGTLL
jgi:hypothetical protein